MGVGPNVRAQNQPRMDNTRRRSSPLQVLAKARAIAGAARMMAGSSSSASCSAVIVEGSGAGEVRLAKGVGEPKGVAPLSVGINQSSMTPSENSGKQSSKRLSTTAWRAAYASLLAAISSVSEGVAGRRSGGSP